MSPITWGSGSDLVMCGSRAVAAPRRTATAAVVVPRPARRVTFAAAASGGAYSAAPAEAAGHQQQQSQLPQSGANSVADIAGVANWLRNRRLTANKESFRIKIVVNRSVCGSLCFSVFRRVVVDTRRLLTQRLRWRLSILSAFRGSTLISPLEVFARVETALSFFCLRYIEHCQPGKVCL